jgi:hypothetical protein
MNGYLLVMAGFIVITVRIANVKGLNHTFLEGSLSSLMYLMYSCISRKSQICHYGNL